MRHSSFISQSVAKVAIVIWMLSGRFSSDSAPQAIGMALAYPSSAADESYDGSASVLSANQHVNEVRYSKRVDTNTCKPGNQQNVPECTQNCAPCWKNERSYYSCFDKVNGQCPWPGMEEVDI